MLRARGEAPPGDPPPPEPDPPDPRSLMDVLPDPLLVDIAARLPKEAKVLFARTCRRALAACSHDLAWPAGRGERPEDPLKRAVQRKVAAGLRIPPQALAVDSSLFEYVMSSQGHRSGSFLAWKALQPGTSTASRSKFPVRVSVHQSPFTLINASRQRPPAQLSWPVNLGSRADGLAQRVCETIADGPQDPVAKPRVDRGSIRFQVRVGPTCVLYLQHLDRVGVLREPPSGPPRGQGAWLPQVARQLRAFVRAEAPAALAANAANALADLRALLGGPSAATGPPAGWQGAACRFTEGDLAVIVTMAQLPVELVKVEEELLGARRPPEDRAFRIFSIAIAMVRILQVAKSQYDIELAARDCAAPTGPFGRLSLRRPAPPKAPRPAAEAAARREIIAFAFGRTCSWCYYMLGGDT